LTPTTLSTVCSLIVDCEHKTAPSDPGGPHPLIRTPDISRGTLLIDQAQRISERTYREWTKRAVPQPGDLILAREAPVGNVGIIPPGAAPALGQRTVLIRADPSNVDPSYLNYLMSGPAIRAWMDGIAAGATVPHLNVADIRALPLPALPSLSNQRKIAAILSAYDDHVENNMRRIKILDEMAQRIYREWFVDLRYPGHESEQLVASERRQFPDGWTESPLSALATVTMGQSPPSSAYNTDHQGLPFHQGVGTYGLIFPTHQVYSSVGSRVAEPGDVLMSVRAPVGRINLADRRLILGRGLASIRAGIAPRGFLWQALKHFFREEDVMGSGSIFQSVTRKDVEDLKLVWPGDNLARRFADLVELNWDLLEILTSQAANLRAARALLLPGLISEAMDVSDLGIAMPPSAA
jgi:type I restriction enzyme S subunit